ncbi:HECT E3 ubiquitin ligase [Achlya hypogyna]|uniref:HECT E3 ubiquitin ligase n=1 Tax=Achlya hypogyna TaxID=1202772 RepID=A0A1V9YAM4_ACHHY|nr:HECT E3 ubiquitin ligase [Achlya hypogyna]
MDSPSTSTPMTTTTVSVSETATADPQIRSREFELPEPDQGWMPKPAMLHSGKSRTCAVCFAPLQYSSMASWDEYLKSEEYLTDLQRNLLQDTYVRGLICGDNYFGDLPTEHRMNPQRRAKCRQNVLDHAHRTSAGRPDDKCLVRTLEEVLLDALPTSFFTYVLERRFAVMFHSAKIVATMMQSDRVQKLERARADATPHVELHHVAIRALSTLLGSFDYTHKEALAPFLDMARMLTNFPPLSLFSYWSPEEKPPEEDIPLAKDRVDASSSATPHPASMLLDANEATYWLTPPRPGMVLLTFSLPAPMTLSSLIVTWHGLHQPQTLALQCKTTQQSASFAPVAEWAMKPGLPLPSALNLSPVANCTAVRLVMSGVPPTNKDGTYGISHVRLTRPKEDVASPHTIMHDIERWLLTASLSAPATSDLVVEAFGALQAWALATGSLSAVARYLDMLLRLGTAGSAHLTTYLLTQASAFYAALARHHDAEIVRIAQATPSTESRKVRAGFEATLCSAGTSVEDGGQTVRTRETSYQHALVNAPITAGKASWKFRLDNDTADDEMTCFGAAILPVTVSGYDSSPSLWMLRGYNGNLYARGHKLSRSIGKVHPGDVVQIDVDLTAGTMAYAINGVDFGVVFTDLAGHEVYPAVSFYGSGKVITLLSLHKWGEATSRAASASCTDPVYLSTLSEYEYGVGHGRFGRGNALGYAGESATEGSQAPTTISVGGEHRQRSLSLHPPARGEAFATYDLGSAYATVEGGVGINDDVASDALAQRGISLVFSLVGDARVLWKSRAITAPGAIESFCADVRGVRMLELRISCSGSNHGAHAIWVDPFVTAVEDWTCTHCTYSNKGGSGACAICGTHATNVEPTPPTPPLTEAAQEEGANLGLLTTREALKAAPIATAVDEIATAIIHKLHALATTLCSTPNYQVQFEEAFCLQPRAATLDVLHILLQASLATLKTLHGRALELAGHRAWLWIELLGFQLQNMERYEQPKDVASPTLLATIKTTLESVASVHLSNPLSPALKSKAWPAQARHHGLQRTAARTLMAGISLLYPSPWDRTSLLLTLLRSHAQASFAPTSARFLMLTKLLESTASPGEMGILTLCPTLPDRTHAAHVHEVLGHLMACTDPLRPYALACLRSFQLYVLSQAIELTKSSQEAVRVRPQERVVTQDAVLQYSTLFLNTCRQVLEGHESMAALQASVVGELLPWFVSGLCLLRRQVWLARPVLPKLARLLRVLDVVAGQSDSVRKAEKRFLALDRRLNAYAAGVDDVGKWQVDASPRRVQKQLYNVFSKLYTGEKDHFEGQIGFQFEAVASFTIVALGRSVNPARNGGTLLHAHTIRLWDEASQALLASISVGPLAKRDAMGYVYEPLPVGVRLCQGKLYRLTTQEFANGGDPWYKKENLPDEEYDGSFIKILRDCYASGSSGFPNSQNLTGAAYGVPTFLVEEDNPMDTLPPVAPLDGVLSLKFNGKRKAHSISLGHLGNAVTVGGESEFWRTCFCTSTFVAGAHTIEFVVKSSRVGGGVSGHLCVGFEDVVATTPRHPVSHAFLGQTEAVASVAWMPAIGAVWVRGQRIAYGGAIAVHHGDVCAMTLDFDARTVVFAHNGQSLGPAPMELPAACLPGVSLYGVHDVVEVRTGGIAKATLQLPWLLDVLETTSSLAGRMTGTLISGPPVDGVEEELQPWLQSKLLSGGLSDAPTYGSGMLSWPLAVKQEWADCTDPQFAPVDEKRRTRKDSLKKCQLDGDGSPWVDAAFARSLPTVVDGIVAWLETTAPDVSMWRRQEKYPKAERMMLAALIKHAPPHLVQEAKAVVTAKEQTDSVASIVPSPEMLTLWKSILTLRHWLIKTKHELPILDETLALPTTFEAFVEHVTARAAFLGSVEPPTGEYTQWGMSSQVALSNLAEKWGSAQTPPSLQPMVDRWRSLSEADSRKWSGLVQVLRAQHKWRTETTMHRPDPTVDDVDDDDGPTADDEAYLSAMVKACDLYVRHGVGAPPAVLYALLERRYLRSESRIFGLDAMRSLLGGLSFDSARYGALVFLRPALRGFTEDERVARESHSEAGAELHPIAFRPTVRHHYLKGLEGCVGRVLDDVQASFTDLYALLAALLPKATSPVLQQSLMCAWGIDFEPRDHEFLLRTDIVAVLSKFCSLATRRADAAAEIQLPVQPNTEWYALSEAYVRDGILALGTVAKRNVVTLVRQAPAFALPLWPGHGQNSKQLTGSAVVSAYAAFLRGLSQRLKWCKPMELGHKALQLNVNDDAVSTVELPALPLSLPSSFTFEIWIFPHELTGYSTLRSDHGFLDGSVHVELVERRLQVAIAGHVPREQLFEHAFHCALWQHIAITYDHDRKQLRLYVDGLAVETRSYSKTTAKVTWRAARLGSWLPDPTTTSVVQRKYKGYLSQLRIWQGVRSQTDILANLHRRVPFLSATPLWSWHLDDGEGEMVVAATASPNPAAWNGLLTKCQWSRTNLPLWPELATPEAWRRFRNGMVALQRQFREHAQQQRAATVLRVKRQMQTLEAIEEHFVFSDDEADATNAELPLPDSYDTTVLTRQQVQRTANLVFRYVGIVAVSGIRERCEVEAIQAALSAKKRRQEKKPASVQPMDKAKSDLSDVAKSAAAAAALDLPIAQRLWFSIELHRKVFDAVEKELSATTRILHEAERLIRAQQPSMLRSMSTPVPMVVASNANEPLESLEVESFAFDLLQFLFSQSHTYPAQEHLTKPAMLRELVMLLRLGSPRVQRMVQLILRRIAPSVLPRHIGAILGSESVFLDSLLDRVSDSICSGVASLSSTIAQSMSESLSNPLGFQTGQIYLTLASESVAVLRLLLNTPTWQTTVADVLGLAIRKAAPIVGALPSLETNLRARATVLRALGALSVLGAHSDCFRIGGKVHVTHGDTAPPLVATLIHRVQTVARVVFDDGDHVQDVAWTALTPIEEIELSPSVVPIISRLELMPILLEFASLHDDTSLWRAQIRSRALLALQSFLRNAKLQHEAATTLGRLLATALTPLKLAHFVSVSDLQERSRSILSRLIEASTPLGAQMFRGLPDPIAPPMTDATAPPPAPSPLASVSATRQGFASTLAAMGFEMDLCLAALEHARDDPNAAVEWLMGEPAEVYRQQQRQRQQQAAVQQAAAATSLPDASRDEKIRDLQLISGCHPRLIVAALDLCGQDSNRAVEWLMEHGRRYSTPLNVHADAFCHASDAALDDAAALEVADQPDLLLLEPGQSADELTEVVDTGLMATTLAPILARAASGAVAPLDPDYLPTNLVLTVSDVAGPVARLSSAGRSGTLVRCHPSDGVLLAFLNTENGAMEESFVQPTAVKRWIKVFDEPLHDVQSIFAVALRTEQALSTYYARRAIVGMLSATVDPSAVLDMVGGAASFVTLLKLVAAATFVAPTTATVPAVPLMEALEAKLVQLVAMPASPVTPVLVSECIAHFVASTKVAQQGTPTTSVEVESLHPYYHRAEYITMVHVPAASTQLAPQVRVVFDKRSCLVGKTSLTLYLDSDCKQSVANFSAAKPFVDVWVPATTFWLKFVAQEENEAMTAYGFRFQVQVVPSIQWRNEADVLDQPSLEYACWLLDFLLHRVTAPSVHNDQVYAALVQYLQSPRAPKKHKVVALLLQLLENVKQFPTMPDLAPLEHMGELAVAQAQVDLKKGKAFVSAPLLQLVELAVVVEQAKSLPQGDLVAPIAPPIVVPSEVANLIPIIHETVQLAAYLAHDASAPMAQDLVTLLWLELFGAATVVEGARAGEVCFPGAHSLRVCLDARFTDHDGLFMAVATVADDADTDGVVWTPIIVSEIMDVAGNALRFTYTSGEASATEMGLSMTVTALGLPLERQLARCSLAQLEACRHQLQTMQWSNAMDAQLVDWVNVHMETPQGDGGGSTDLAPADIRLHPTLDGLRCSLLLHLPLSTIQLRYALLRCFNVRLAACMPLIDLSDASSPWAISHKLRALSHCIFFETKQKVVEAAIEATVVAVETTNTNATARITLDRLRALESREDREVEPSVSECFFAQAFRQLHSVDTKALRRKIDSKGRLFSVKFRGEEGVDWGGVYREGTNSMVDDLFGAHFSLFLLCPNGQHNTGLNRGMYLPNAKCTSPVAIEMLEFGISLRTRGDFPFAFCPLVWKMLLRQPLDRQDLEGTDTLLVQMLDGIRHCDADGITTDAQFEAAFADLDLRFTTYGSNGQLVELVPGGGATPVTFANRVAYCDSVENYRLREVEVQVNAMRRGLAALYPLRVLTLLTWQEMEMLTCGSPKIDIAVWRQHTRYDGYTEHDETVHLFWEVMASFTDEQRSDFVRFAWGRSRLPRGKWPQPFKLTKKGGRDSALSLPVAHTCFFSVELPPYTTKQKMREMLLATINFGLGGILIA